MAQVNSSLGTGGLKRIRRWYNQYLSTHGSPPPESMMRTYMQSEIEAQIASADRSRALGLEEKRIDLSSSQFDRSLALQKEKMADEAEAAKMSGYTNLALVGVLGKDIIKSGYDKLFPGKTIAPATEAVPLPGTAPQALPTTTPQGAVPIIAPGVAGAVPIGINAASAGGTGAVTLGGAEAGIGIGSTVAEGGGSAITLGGAEGSIGIGSTSSGAGAVSLDASAGAALSEVAPATTGMSSAAAGGYAAAILGAEALTSPWIEEQLGTSVKHATTVGAYAGAGATIGTSIVPGYGTIIGAVIGAGVGVVREVSGTVVCTELHRQGLLNDDIYEADIEFGKKQDLDVMLGYHSWGIPLAGLMRQSKFVTWIIKPIALAWAENMAYMEGATNKRNLFGAAIHSIGMPLCRAIGRAKMGGKIWAL